MRVAFVLDDSLDRPDGVQQYVLTLGEWLKKQGHQVFYLVGHTVRTDISGVYSLTRILKVPINGNIVGTPLPANKRAIKALLKKLDLDVIHVQILYSPAMAGKIIESVSDNTAVVGTIHIFPSTAFSQAMYKLESVMNNKTLKRFDEIVAVSQAAAEASHLSKARSIKIIPNPVDIKRFQQKRNIKKPGHKIVFLGRLVPRKGCQILLEAIARLHNDKSPLTNVIVEVGGTGPLASKLKTFVQKNNLQEVVTFKGFIPENDKAAFLQSADIAVFPSSGGESFGIVLIESMAAGALTLGGNNPGYACVLGENSSELFAPSNSTVLADKLKRLMQDAKHADKIYIAQQERVKQFDINIVGGQIVTTYNKALRSRLKMG